MSIVTDWLNQSRRFPALLVLALLLCGAVMPGAARAQSRLVLSRHSDFSTQDRRFNTSDTLYIRVSAEGLDPATVEENVFALRPDGTGQTTEGTFANHLDGTFSASIPLAQMVGETIVWELTAELRDGNDHVFEQEARLVIQGLVTAPEIVVLRGTVEAAGAGSISVGGRTIQITGDTVIRTTSGAAVTPGALLDAQVVVRAQVDGTDGLVASVITVLGADSGQLQLEGRIARVDAAAGALQIRGFEMQLNASTLIRDKAGTTLSVDTLAVGQYVAVQAERIDSVWAVAEVTLLKEQQSEGTHGEDDAEERLVGVVEAVGADYTVVAGSHFVVDAETEFEEVEGLAGLSPGLRVSVMFVTRSDGSLLAREIEGGEEQGEDEVEVTGTLAAVTAEAIEVSGLRFLIDAETEIEGSSEIVLTAADLYSGLLVEVKGRLQDDATIVAERIKIEQELATEVEVKGTITVLVGDTLHIGDVAALITPATVIRGERGAELTAAALQVGMLAEVELVQQVGRVPVAVRVRVEKPFEEDDVETVGRIEAVSSLEITVGALTFAIDADTEVEARGDTQVTVADLRVDQVVRVKGYETPDGGRVATEIRLIERMHAKGYLEGLITSVGSDTVEVAGIVLRLSPQSRIVGPNTLRELQAGQRVEVDFRLLGDGSRLVVRIKPEEETHASVLLKGSVDTVGTASFVVAGITFSTANETTFSDAMGAALTLSDLTPGDRIRVEADASSGTLVALKVRVEQAAVVAGTIESIDGESMRVAGLDIGLSHATRIFRPYSSDTGGDVLAPGDYIEVLTVSGSSETTSAKAGTTTPLTAESIDVRQSTSSTGRQQDETVSAVFVLEPNHPNPFSQQTTFRFRLNESSHVTLRIYNAVGQEVATLLEATLAAGVYEAQWDGRTRHGQAAASGLYLCRVEAGGQVTSRPIVLVK